MTFAKALFLGILQGLTEFLPVSSSGHLVLVQNLFGFEDMEKYVLFDLVLHLGTLFAVVIVFRSNIIRILKTQRVYIIYLVIGFVAIFPFYPCIGFLRSCYNRPEILGVFFLITAAVLFAGEKVRFVRTDIVLSPLMKGIHAAIIGVFQVVAILPGVSRSGTTISVARILGWKSEDAAEFSFLLAIPLIGAGALYEMLPYIKGDMCFDAAVPVGSYVAGFISSCLVGVVALRWLMVILNRGKFGYFSLYCVLLGVVTLIFFNI